MPRSEGLKLPAVAGADIAQFQAVFLNDAMSDGNTLAFPWTPTVQALPIGMALQSALSGESLFILVLGTVTNPAWSFAPVPLIVGADGFLVLSAPNGLPQEHVLAFGVTDHMVFVAPGLGNLLPNGSTNANALTFDVGGRVGRVADGTCGQAKRSLGLGSSGKSTPTDPLEVCISNSSDTQLVIKMKGSDGVVRSANLALA